MQEFKDWLKEVKGISVVNTEGMEQLYKEFLEWKNQNSINKVEESDIIK